MSSDDNETSKEVLRIVQSMDTGIRNLSTRVEALESKLEAFITESDNRWTILRTQLTDIKTDIQSDIRKLHRKFDVLNEDVSEVRADIRDANRRMDKLEEKAS